MQVVSLRLLQIPTLKMIRSPRSFNQVKRIQNW